MEERKNAVEEAKRRLDAVRRALDGSEPREDTGAPDEPEKRAVRFAQMLDAIHLKHDEPTADVVLPVVDAPVSDAYAGVLPAKAAAITRLENVVKTGRAKRAAELVDENALLGLTVKEEETAPPAEEPEEEASETAAAAVPPRPLTLSDEFSIFLDDVRRRHPGLSAAIYVWDTEEAKSPTHMEGDFGDAPVFAGTLFGDAISALAVGGPDGLYDARKAIREFFKSLTSRIEDKRVMELVREAAEKAAWHFSK